MPCARRASLLQETGQNGRENRDKTHNSVSAFGSGLSGIFGMQSVRAIGVGSDTLDQRSNPKDKKLSI